MLSVGEAELDGIRQARARAQRAGVGGGRGAGRVVLDFDATPITAHSEKEQAAGHYKGGFGFHPLLVSCGREVLTGILRPGNAGANNAEDHLGLLELALEQLPQAALDGEILARSDSAGASHDLAVACRETRHPLLVGLPADRARPRGDPVPLENRPGSRRSTRTARSATGRGWPS